MTIQELSERTGFEPRTIRGYIERKLLPPSYGRGMRAGYGSEHVMRLNFISAVRAQAKLPLDDIRELIESLPGDQVQRVAQGEEEVRAFSSMGHPYAMGAPMMEFKSSAEEPWFSARRSHTEKETQTRSPKTWMTAEIAEGLELRQRGHDPEDLRRMTRLAHMLIAWLEEERERETPR